MAHHFSKGDQGLLELMQFHFERMWKARHTSELLIKSLKDNIRGQRGVQKRLKEGQHSA